MMKFIVIYVLSAACCYNLYSQKISSKPFLIKGKFSGIKTKVISCSYRNAFDKWVKKDCEIVNGNFSFNDSLSGPTIMWMESNLASPRMDDPNYVEILIEPGSIEILLIENQFKSVKVKGSSIQHRYKLLEKNKVPVYTKMQPLETYLNILNDSIDYLRKLNDSNRIAQVVVKRELILDQIAPFKQQLNQIEMSYVVLHTNDYLSAFLLEKQYSIYHLDKDSAKFYCSNFSAIVQNSYWTKFILMDIKKREGSSLGAVANDFVISDSRGLKIALSAFKNKNVILLDFWASWCIPCREAIPHLKLSFNKYQTKGFVVIAISQDKDKAAWLNAIQIDDTNNWNHALASNDKEDISETDIGMKYQTNPIPLYYLINKEGIIVGKWVGQTTENEEEIDKKLNEIFKF